MLRFQKLKIAVFRDGIIIGHIFEAKGGAGGYYFKPFIGKPGEVFSTIDAVKRSLTR